MQYKEFVHSLFKTAMQEGNYKVVIAFLKEMSNNKEFCNSLEHCWTFKSFAGDVSMTFKSEKYKKVLMIKSDFLETWKFSTWTLTESDRNFIKEYQQYIIDGAKHQKGIC